MRNSIVVRSFVLLGALSMMGGFVYWRAFAARPLPGDVSPGDSQAAAAGQPAFDPLLMPGSKSAILVGPSAANFPAEVVSADVFSAEHATIPAGVVLPGAPANAAPPPAPAPEPANPPAAQPAAGRRVFLPGSKSMILPELLPSQPSAQPVAPQQRAANPRRPQTAKAQQLRRRDVLAHASTFAGLSHRPSRD